MTELGFTSVTCRAFSSVSAMPTISISTEDRSSRRVPPVGILTPSQACLSFAEREKRLSKMNYAISEVYVIVLMDGFTFPDSSKERYLHDICLCNRENGEVFYEDLGFIYIELLNFVKEEAELKTDLDWWLYLLKNLSKMDKIPLFLRKPIFEFCD